MRKYLLPLIYVVFAVFYLISGVFNFAYDRIKMPEEQKIEVSQLYAENMKQIDDNTFVATTNDPQFIFISNVEIHTLKYTLKQGGTGSKALYYKNAKDIDWSPNKILLPKAKEIKNVKYIIPENNVTSVRLDISGTFTEIIEIEEIVINYRPKFVEYFYISSMDFAKFIVIPIVISSILLYFFDLYEHYFKKLKNYKYKTTE